MNASHFLSVEFGAKFIPNLFENQKKNYSKSGGGNKQTNKKDSLPMRHDDESFFLTFQS